MNWTVGITGQYSGPVVGPTDLVGTLKWIHAQLPLEELMSVLSEVARDVAQGKAPIVECCWGDEGFMAAAYFRVLPGSVATLGGVRVADSIGKRALPPGQLKRHVELILNALCARLEEKGIAQIQAVFNQADKSTAQLVQLGGFLPITVVQQLWFDVAAGQAESSLPPGFAWSNAATRDSKEMIELLKATFVDTLDCPEIGQLRGPGDLLLSFLEGRSLAEIRNWHLLNYEGQPIGCALLTRHDAEVIELAYMGLHPRFRGRSIGARLVEKAIASAQQLGGRYLLVAVDENNWPALDIYHRHGFVHHQSKSVFFHRSNVKHLPAADAA